MPTDLDQMFAALGRDADAVPMADGEFARRRGVRRTRRQATTVVALAVVLVAAGVGGLAWVRRPVGAPADAPGTLPTVGQRISFGGPADRAVPQIENPMINPTRAYVSWSGPDGTRVIAADLNDGHRLWQSVPVAAGYDEVSTIVISGAIVLTAVRETGSAGRIWVLDPNSGRVWRQGPYDFSDQHVFYPQALVTLHGSTGVIDAVAWDTGATTWTVPADADRPARITGVATLLDRTSQHTFRNYGTGDKPVETQLIEITRSGKIICRDTESGRVTSRVPATVNPNGRQYAYAGDLVTVSDATPYRIGLTDLTTGRQATWTGPAGRTFGQVTPCGPATVCVADEGTRPELALIDLNRNQQVWRVPAAGDVLDYRDSLLLAIGGGGPMTVYDTRSGRKVASGPQLYWLDDDRMLELPATGPAGGPVAFVSGSGARTELGTVRIPPPSLCAWTTSRLICTGRTGFQIYALAA